MYRQTVRLGSYLGNISFVPFRMSLAILTSLSSFVELELAAAIATTISKYKVELPPDVLYPPVSSAQPSTL